MSNDPILLDGKALAYKLGLILKSDVEIFTKAYDVEPTLAIIMIGANPTCMKYTRMKRDAAEGLGIHCLNIDLPEKIPPEKIIEKISNLNGSKDVHGIMIQHPIPQHLEILERRFFDEIFFKKDVDGLTSTNFAKLALNINPVAFKPATARGILRLLLEYHIDVFESRVVVIGSSPILGLPLSLMLHQLGATVSICNINTDFSYLNMLCQQADIIIGACGIPNLVNPLMVRQGVILIDVGCCPGTEGVFAPQSYKKASYYTKPIGCVGPMTVQTLMYQTVQAAKELKRNGIL